MKTRTYHSKQVSFFNEIQVTRIYEYSVDVFVRVFLVIVKFKASRNILEFLVSTKS